MKFCLHVSLLVCHKKGRVNSGKVVGEFVSSLFGEIFEVCMEEVFKPWYTWVGALQAFLLRECGPMEGFS